MQYKKIIDISIPLSNGTVVYPGDPAVQITTFKPLKEGQSRLSQINMGTHSGTHIDAPAHTMDGKEVNDLPLSNFVGSCRVLDFSDVEEKISKEDLLKKEIKSGERILVKTKNSSIGFDTWRNDFIYLDGDAADFLAEVEIVLFGIDTWSVKQKGSKDNRAHNSLLSKNIPIIETINLNGVSEGEYFLVCLPLKIIGVEGAPARVVLLQ